ncbi:unnamed protein product [Didymodactylos carnosus]|uniref:Calcineurin-like phosphoesterase domain-containing protein n=1 Tax=Didymodactylos carnosus TaxID=1234261 RepID=A0A8S2LZP2_9BILA|nr:unnamed protein product [Didymodactylos carnosus]CAF3915766.1 unnamed protein product [Didymodactylos carnosus]
MAWVEQLPNDTYSGDTLIVAGDITHILSKLEQTLRIFKSKFKEVYYCPGNHELWISSNDTDLGIKDSVSKFFHILELCEEIGVHTRTGISEGVTIVPLFGWYDESLHIPMPEVEVPREGAAKYFVQLNTAHMPNPLDTTKVITFSHFFTSRKLMNAYGDEMRRRRKEIQKTAQQLKQEQDTVRANFSLVAGTDLFDKQIELLHSLVHIFGHSHRKMQVEIDGTRYINNPLGYTYERAAGLIAPPHDLLQIDI